MFSTHLKRSELARCLREPNQSDRDRDQLQVGQREPVPMASDSLLQPRAAVHEQESRLVDEPNGGHEEGDEGE